MYRWRYSDYSNNDQIQVRIKNRLLFLRIQPTGGILMNLIWVSMMWVWTMEWVMHEWHKSSQSRWILICLTARKDGNETQCGWRLSHEHIHLDFRWSHSCLVASERWVHLSSDRVEPTCAFPAVLVAWKALRQQNDSKSIWKSWVVYQQFSTVSTCNRCFRNEMILPEISFYKRGCNMIQQSLPQKHIVDVCLLLMAEPHRNWLHCRSSKCWISKSEARNGETKMLQHDNHLWTYASTQYT